MNKKDFLCKIRELTLKHQFYDMYEFFISDFHALYYFKFLNFILKAKMIIIGRAEDFSPFLAI